MSDQITAEFAALFEGTYPAELTHQITRIQTRLLALTTNKTAALTANVSRAISVRHAATISRAT